jgi:hypothetical protein
MPNENPPVNDDAPKLGDEVPRMEDGRPLEVTSKAAIAIPFRLRSARGLAVRIEHRDLPDEAHPRSSLNQRILQIRSQIVARPRLTATYLPVALLEGIGSKRRGTAVTRPSAPRSTTASVTTKPNSFRSTKTLSGPTSATGLIFASIIRPLIGARIW